MNTNARSAVIVMVAVLLFCVERNLWSQTVVVGTCEGGAVASHTTIQDAVNAAPAGGVVMVCPGRYEEQISITKPLSVKGEAKNGKNAIVIVAPPGGLVANTVSLDTGQAVAAQIVVHDADGVKLDDLIVDGRDNGITGCAPQLVGVLYQNSSGTVSNVVMRNQTLSTHLVGCQSGFGFYAQSDSSSSSIVTLRDNLIHNYQKNGITGIDAGTSLFVKGNTVQGKGPTSEIAQNGIQIGPGATGTITQNSVFNDIFTPGTVTSIGILVFAARGVVVRSNTVGATQGGIGVFSDKTFGAADNSRIVSNTVFSTELFDGIEVCSNGNTVRLNRVGNSSEAAIHVASTCGTSSGKNNVVTNNVLTEACAGVLEDTGASGNIFSVNRFSDVLHLLLVSDTCSAQTPSADSVASVKGSARSIPAPARL